MIGYVILGLTLAFFAGVAVWVFTEGRRLRWPNGRTYYGHLNGRIVRLVIEHDITNGGPVLGAHVAHRAVKAVEVARTSWRHNRGEPKDVRDVCVLLLSDTTFDEPGWSRGMASYQTWVPRMVGKSDVPLIVVRERYRDLIVETGQPVIHEMLHAFNDAPGDRTHEDPTLWGGMGTVEGMARELFAT